MVGHTLLSNVPHEIFTFADFNLLDYLKSTLHRVGLPPLQDRFTGDERMTRARYSIPYFMTTAPDLLIETMPSKLCVNESRPSRYEPITQREYAASRAKMQY